jgi:putative toxin-antitoxin system antitoxin component (TIGR02293 family)
MEAVQVKSARSNRVSAHTPAESDWLAVAELDALCLAIITDKQLKRRVSGSEKVDLGAIRSHIAKVLARYRTEAPRPTAQPIDMHQRVMEGFGGEAIFISSALLLDTLGEAEKFFHLSFKTIKSKVGHVLEPGPSELALRMARATLAAADVFGDIDAGRAYLRTRNFALGGAAPIDLLQTAEGERIVLNELQTQADGGPV